MVAAVALHAHNGAMRGTAGARKTPRMAHAGMLLIKRIIGINSGGIWRSDSENRVA